MARQELFRREVVQAQRGQWLGSVHLAVPLSFRWLALLIAALAAAIVLFMVFGHHTRHQIVSGQLVPSAGLLGVHSPTPGTIARVYVHEGESVHRGDPLVEISGERDSAAFGATQALIGAQLRAEAKRLQEQLVEQQQSTEQQFSGLRVKLGTFKAQVRLINGQLQLQRAQAASDAHLLESIKPLHQRGIISDVEFDRYQNTAMSDQAQIKSLELQRLTTRQQVATVQQQLALLPLDLVAKQNATRQALSQNSQQLAQNELQSNAVLRAPVTGIISTLLVKYGQSVSAEEPLLSVLPEGSSLQAQLLVPSSVVGFVRPGSQVVLRYQAFPYQEFGQQYGRVKSVSRSALSNGEATVLTGTHPSQPLYRVLVTLNRQTIPAYGNAHRLQPGMAIDADILLDRRSLWQWTFAPLSGLKQRVTAGGGIQS